MALPASYDINNPYVNVFLTKPFSGANLTANYVPSNKNQIVGTDIQSILTPYAKYIISHVIEQYNTKYSTNYLPTDFGIANIPNDQNSKCAYLIFPLLTSITLVLRVYLELSNSIEAGFNFIDYTPEPTYLTT